MNQTAKDSQLFETNLFTLNQNLKANLKTCLYYPELESFRLIEQHFKKDLTSTITKVA